MRWLWTHRNLPLSELCASPLAPFCSPCQRPHLLCKELAMNPPQPESRSFRDQVRLALGSLFLVEADFLAFVGDYFPKTRQRLGDGMDRVQKVNLLLDQEGAEAVVAKLRVAQREALAEYEQLHGPLRAEPRAESNTEPLGETVRRSPWIAVLAVGAVVLTAAGAFGLALVSRHESQPGNHLDDRTHKPQDLGSPPDLTAPLQPLAGALFNHRNQPLAGTRVVVLEYGVEGRTNPDGLFRLEVRGKPEESVTLRIDLGHGRVHDHNVTLGNTQLGWTVPQSP